MFGRGTDERQFGTQAYFGIPRPAAAANGNVGTGTVVNPLPPAAPSTSTSSYTSTQAHRSTQLGNLAMQVASTALGSLSLPTRIPFAVSQSFLSIYSVFNSNLTVAERVVQAIQGGLTATQAALFIVMLYQNNNSCDTVPPVGALCITQTILDLIYSGVLTSSTAMAQMSQAPSPPALGTSSTI